MNDLKNHIEEYLRKEAKENNFIELFEVDENENLDLKTELNDEEIVLLNKIKINYEFLLGKRIDNIYKKYMDYFMRLKISKERRSRAEFVDVNRKERFEQNLKKFGQFRNLEKVKE